MSTVPMFFKMAKKAESVNLANSREQRKNAGNKMSKLLADELGDDEFYKTALGGFVEESGDEEYVSEDEQSDQVDSDFSLSETDEVLEQDVEDEGKRKRKKTFYKNPVRPRSEPKEKEAKVGVKNIATEKKIKKEKPSTESRQSSRKSTRATTVQSSDKSFKKMQGKKVYKKQVKFSQHRPLTQKELLAEAKLTEQLNIASLEAYQQMEETKKKAKNLRPVRKEPMIRYLSLSMPVVEMNEEIKVDDDGCNNNHLEIPVDHDQEKATERKCSRNFIIFTDPKTFPGSYFSSNISVRQKAYCPVTGLPAKYKDPVTGLPYATGQAFRYIREHYAKQTAHADSKPGESRLRSSRRQSQHTGTEAI